MDDTVQGVAETLIRELGNDFAKRIKLFSIVMVIGISRYMRYNDNEKYSDCQQQRWQMHYERQEQVTMSMNE
jgi:hypothetical protein